MKEYKIVLDNTTAKIFETLVEITNKELKINVTVEDAMAEIITQFVQQNYVKYVTYIRKSKQNDDLNLRENI